MENKVKVGTIFKCSWGYDQTNVDFFKCVGFTPCFMKYVAVETVIADRKSTRLNSSHPSRSRMPSSA